MDFVVNKTPVEIIIEGAFGDTYFTDIYSNVNGKVVEKAMERI